jgi:hypothetical protein
MTRTSLENGETDQGIESSRGGWFRGVAGFSYKTQDILAQLFELSEKRNVPPQDIALVYIGTGEFDHALEWLTKARRERLARLIWLRVHPKVVCAYNIPAFTWRNSDAMVCDLLRVPVNVS